MCRLPPALQCQLFPPPPWEVRVAWTPRSRRSAAGTPLPFLSLVPPVWVALAEQTCTAPNLGPLPPLGRLGVKLRPWDGDFGGAKFALPFAVAAPLPWANPALAAASFPAWRCGQQGHGHAAVPSSVVPWLLPRLSPKRRWAVYYGALRGLGVQIGP